MRKVLPTLHWLSCYRLTTPRRRTLLSTCRYNFNTRCRKQDESISEFVAALWDLALHCKFSSKELLEEMLRDRLVCGVNHQGIQRNPLWSWADTWQCFQAGTWLTIEESERDSKKLGKGPTDNSKKDINYLVLRVPFPGTAVEAIT